MLNFARQMRRRLFPTPQERRLREAPFYRQYPYGGGVRMSMVDLRGMCGLEHGFFFNRIPKSANSTVSVFLARNSGIRSVSGDQEGNWAKNAFPRPGDLSIGEVERLNECFKFTIVRDPYTRVLSAFLDKVKTGKKMRALPDFRTFCQFLDQGGLYANAHWAPQSELLLIPLYHFDFIGRVESLVRDMQVIGERLGFQTVDENERAGPNATDAEKLIAEHLDDRSRAIINRLYAADFGEFGYSKL